MIARNPKLVDGGFPYEAQTVTLIRIRGDDVEFANSSKTEKRELLMNSLPGDKWIAVWKGQWTADAFLVDLEAAVDSLFSGADQRVNRALANVMLVKMVEGNKR